MLSIMVEKYPEHQKGQRTQSSALFASFKLISEKVTKPRRRSWIGRIFTYPRASAFHDGCSSLEKPASGASVSAFICVHLRFFYDVIFQTGLTGSTGYVFNHVHRFILPNLLCQLPIPERLRSGGLNG